MRNKKVDIASYDITNLSQLNDLDYISANAFRDLKTNIEYQLYHKEKKIVIITSANTNEGKSYCTFNLARAFAESKKKVLIIDMDLQKARMSNLLGISTRPGITDFYEGDISENQIINKLDECIYAISCGRPTLNITEVLSSNEISSFVELQSRQFDIVIIDSPPIRVTPESKIIISKFKNVLFVVKDNHTRKFEIEEALDSIKFITPTLLGMIVNYKKYTKKQRKKYGYGYR